MEFHDSIGSDGGWAMGAVDLQGQTAEVPFSLSVSLTDPSRLTVWVCWRRITEETDRPIVGFPGAGYGGSDVSSGEWSLPTEGVQRVGHLCVADGPIEIVARYGPPHVEHAGAESAVGPLGAVAEGVHALPLPAPRNEIEASIPLENSGMAWVQLIAEAPASAAIWTDTVWIGWPNGTEERFDRGGVSTGMGGSVPGASYIADIPIRGFCQPNGPLTAFVEHVGGPVLPHLRLAAIAGDPLALLGRPSDCPAPAFTLG